MMAAIILLAVGIGIGILFVPEIPVVLQPYLAVLIVVSLDSIFSGVHLLTSGKFKTRFFVGSFLTNALAAAVIAFIGSLVGVGPQMLLALLITFGIRIFRNISKMQRRWFSA